MKSLIVHLRNKYPECRVEASSSSISVRDEQGELVVLLQKSAHGAFEDVSEEYGASDKFDLSPIPKEARIHKLGKDGKIGKDELHEERVKSSKEILEYYGKIPSIEQLRKDSNYDDHQGKVVLRKKEAKKQEKQA